MKKTKKESRMTTHSIKNNTTIRVTAVVLVVGVLFSCKKQMDSIPPEQTINEVALSSTSSPSAIYPYSFSRVYDNNVPGASWEEVQIDLDPNGGPNIVSSPTGNVGVSCPPQSLNSWPGLYNGAAYLQLPVPVRRVRLNNKAYGGTKLDHITELKFSTYIVATKNQSGLNLALQIDTDNDGQRDFNLAFETKIQNGQYPHSDTVATGKWQTWDALQGVWYITDIDPAGTPPPFTTSQRFTIQDFLAKGSWSKAPRILNTSPLGVTTGGGIRFTVGGSRDYDNFKGYIDAVIIGIQGEDKSLLFDFVCQ